MIFGSGFLLMSPLRAPEHCSRARQPRHKRFYCTGSLKARPRRRFIAKAKLGDVPAMVATVRRYRLREVPSPSTRFACELLLAVTCVKDATFAHPVDPSADSSIATSSVGLVPETAPTSSATEAELYPRVSIAAPVCVEVAVCGLNVKTDLIAS